MKPNPSRSCRIPSHDEIERLAYEIWQRRGCPIGRSLECWLEAERALAGRGPQRPHRIKRRHPDNGGEDMEQQLDDLLARTTTESRSATAL